MTEHQRSDPTELVRAQAELATRERNMRKLEEDLERQKRTNQELRESHADATRRLTAEAGVRRGLVATLEGELGSFDMEDPTSLRLHLCISDFIVSPSLIAKLTPKH